ncbi:MAG: hypothetical protein ACYTAF_11465 [Planctomycetota bacterium]
MRTAWIIPVVLFALSAGAQEQEGPKACKLTVAFEVGRKVSTAETYSQKGGFVIKSGQGEQKIDTSEERIFECTDEILEVDDQRWHTRVRRTVRKGRVKTKGAMDEGPVEKAMQLEGKTFVVVQKGKEVVFEGLEEAPPDMEKKVNSLSRPVFIEALPEGDVKVGATWEVPEEKLKEEFSAAEDEGGGMEVLSGKATGTLKSLSAEDGAIATIVYTVSLDGRMGAFKTGYKVTVTFRIDTGRSRLLDMDVEGTMTMSGSTEQGGETIEMSGEFKVTAGKTASYE